MQRRIAILLVLMLAAGGALMWGDAFQTVASSATQPVQLMRDLADAYPAFVAAAEKLDATVTGATVSQEGRLAARTVNLRAGQVGRIAAHLQMASSAYALQNSSSQRWSESVTTDTWNEWANAAEAKYGLNDRTDLMVGQVIPTYLSAWQPALQLKDGWENAQWDLQQLQLTMAIAASVAAALSQEESKRGVVPAVITQELDRKRATLLDLAVTDPVPWSAVVGAAHELQQVAERALAYAPEESRLLATYQLALLVEWTARARPTDPQTVSGVAWWSYLLALDALGPVSGMALMDSALVADVRWFSVKGKVSETVLQRAGRMAVTAIDLTLPDPTIVSKGSKVYKAAKKAYKVGDRIVLATRASKDAAKTMSSAYMVVDTAMETQGIIETVIDSFGGIPGVEIDVQMEGQPALSMVTGSSGQYETPLLQPAAYHLDLTHAKYEPQSLDLVLAPYWTDAYVDGAAVPVVNGVIEVDVIMAKQTMKALADHGLNLAGGILESGGILLCVAGIAGALETFGASIALCAVGGGLFFGGRELEQVANDPDSEFSLIDYRDESQKPVVTGLYFPDTQLRAPAPKQPTKPNTQPVLQARTAPPGTTSTVFVVDVSPSMETPVASGESRVDAVTEAVRGLLQIIAFDARESGRPHQVGLVLFGETAVEVHPLDEDYAGFEDALRRLKSISSTDIGAGLTKGLQSLSAWLGTRSIILLTDGETNRGLSPEQILGGPVSKAAKDGVILHTIGFGIQDDLLKHAASLTGGEYLSIADSFTLQRQYLKLHQETKGEILGEFGGQVEEGKTVDAGSVTVTTGDLHATLVWPGSDMNLILIDPTGRAVTESYPGAHILSHGRPKQILVENSLPGKWTLLVEGVEVPPGGEPYAVVVSQPERTTVPVTAAVAAGLALLLCTAFILYLKQTWAAN